MSQRFPSGREREESPSLLEAYRLLDLHNLHAKDQDRTLSPTNAKESSTYRTKQTLSPKLLTKHKIQTAFLRAAQRYHPDGRHRADACPSAERFRRCLEARRLLLSHHCGIHPKNHDATRSPRYYYDYGRYDRGGGRSGGFGLNGFPFRTLKLLTPKQNLILRGGVFAVLAIGTVYDDWSRKGRRTKKRKVASCVE